MALKFEINADEILAAFTQFKEEAQKALEESFEKMVFDAYADIVKQASTLSSATNQIIHGSPETAARCYSTRLGNCA